MPTLKKTPVTRTSKTPANPVTEMPRPTSSPSVDLYEQVRRRAYELYEQRGRLDGFAVQDWLQAERELKTRRTA